MMILKDILVGLLVLIVGESFLCWMFYPTVFSNGIKRINWSVFMDWRAPLIFSIPFAIFFIVWNISKTLKKKSKDKKTTNDTLLIDTPNQEKITLEQEFERQKTLANNQFDHDKKALSFNASPTSFKRMYEMNIGPIVKKSIGKPVDMWELGYFELYLNHPQFCDLFDNDEVKLVYDRFYERYPLLKPDGYDKINFANFTRDRSSFNSVFKKAADEDFVAACRKFREVWEPVLKKAESVSTLHSDVGELAIMINRNGTDLKSAGDDFIRHLEDSAKDDFISSFKDLFETDKNGNIKNLNKFTENDGATNKRNLISTVERILSFSDYKKINN
jgi:hypothetical protein